MKMIMLFLFLLICSNAEAKQIFIRDDGGSMTECDGTADAPKNQSKKCAYNNFYSEITFSDSAADTVTITKGRFFVNIRLPDIWIPMSTFVASPLQYITAVKNGRKVYFNDLGGLAWELQLRKY